MVYLAMYGMTLRKSTTNRLKKSTSTLSCLWKISLDCIQLETLGMTTESGINLKTLVSLQDPQMNEGSFLV